MTSSGIARGRFDPSLFELVDPQSSRRWRLAGAGVLAFHLGVALIAANWQGERVAPPPRDMAIALDLAPMPASSEPKAAAAPAAAAQPAAMERPAPVEPQKPVMRPDIPVPVVAPHIPLPVAAAVAAAPAPASAAPAGAASGSAEAAGSSTNAARPGSTMAATGTGQQGAGGGADAAAAWRGRVLAHLDRHKRYPAAAKQMKREGRVHVRMTLDRRGNVLDVSLDRGAGFPPFDREAIATVRRADPLPPPPAELNGSVIPLHAPIGFYLPGSR